MEVRSVVADTDQKALVSEVQDASKVTTQIDKEKKEIPIFYFLLLFFGFCAIFLRYI